MGRSRDGGWGGLSRGGGGHLPGLEENTSSKSLPASFLTRLSHGTWHQRCACLNPPLLSSWAPSALATPPNSLPRCLVYCVASWLRPRHFYFFCSLTFDLVSISWTGKLPCNLLPVSVRQSQARPAMRTAAASGVSRCNPTNAGVGLLYPAGAALHSKNVLAPARRNSCRTPLRSYRLWRELLTAPFKNPGTDALDEQEQYLHWSRNLH